MGLIQFDKPRARPTPNDVGASKAWIGRGLVALFDARYGIERISGDRASVNTATRAVSEGGVAADFSGTANQRYAHRPAYAQSGPFSLLILCDIDALTGYGALISKQQSSTTHCPYELRIGSGATDSKFEVVRCSATNFGTAQASATSILSAPAKLVRLVLSVTNSDKAALGTLWVNGVGYSLNGIVSGEDATGTGTPDVWIGRRQDGATQLDGRIYHIGLVNRAVTAGEAYDFTRNPWSVFEPKRIWVPVSAGGGGTYNVTLAESTAAADALGAVGSVVAFVAEAAAASELASTVGTVAAAVSESAAAAETLAAVAAVAAALTDPATVADLVAATMVAQAAVAEALAAADARNHLLEEQIDVQAARITVLTESNRLLRAQLDEQTANRDATTVYAASLHAAYVPPPRQRLTRQHATRLTRQRARDTALLAVLVLGGAALVVCGLLVLGAGFAALRAWGQ